MAFTFCVFQSNIYANMAQEENVLSYFVRIAVEPESMLELPYYKLLDDIVGHGGGSDFFTFSYG